MNELKCLGGGSICCTQRFLTNGNTVTVSLSVVNTRCLTKLQENYRNERLDSGYKNN